MAKGYKLATGIIRDPREFMVDAVSAEHYLQKCGATIFIRNTHTTVNEAT
ncbi:hypothetical protein SynBIOSU31_02694 [Synechococcus sp. BIOS-U3-1]|nr:hypothetical protein SynBIOSU31_02694 [Synechococcus sp. BIOS-U3-1]